MHCLIVPSTITELGHYPLASVPLIGSLTTEPAGLFANDVRIIRSMHFAIWTFGLGCFVKIVNVFTASNSQSS